MIYFWPVLYTINMTYACLNHLHVTHRGFATKWGWDDETYIFVIDQFHEFELSVGPLRMRHVLKRSRQFLNRHILRSDGVIRRAATEMQKINYALNQFKLLQRKCRIKINNLKLNSRVSKRDKDLLAFTYILLLILINYTACLRITLSYLSQDFFFI